MFVGIQPRKGCFEVKVGASTVVSLLVRVLCLADTGHEHVF